IMKSNAKLGFVGLLVMSALCAGACVGAADPPAGEGPVGEAQQLLVTCTTDCSAVSGASPITQTCNVSCTTNNSQITCDGVTTLCTSQCAANYGKTCVAAHCRFCGTSGSYALYGTYDCTGVCETTAECAACCGRSPC